MYSLLIKNARIADGSGSAIFNGDIAIEGDKIVQIAAEIKTKAITTIDAEGLLVCPGFIDVQNHSDSYWQLFDNPNLDSLISQGYTTIFVGQCGASLAPLLSQDSLLSLQKWHNLDGVNRDWGSFAELITTLSANTYGCNIGTLVGYDTIKRGLVGDSKEALTQTEVEAVKSIIAEALDLGAFGLSLGLSYSHEIGTTALQLVPLAKTVAEKNALLSIHLRNEETGIIDSVEEVIELIRQTGVNTKISHLKIRGSQNWQYQPDVLDKLETAYHQGLPIHFDSYPYDTTWQVLYSYLPKWAIEGGRKTMLKHFRDSVQRNKILTYLGNLETEIKNLVIASTANRLNVNGKTLATIAKDMEVSSEAALLELIEKGGSEALVFDQNLSSELVEKFISHPLCIPASDGGGFSLQGRSRTNRDKLVHPRCFGTTPKTFKVLQNQGYSLEDTIKKLSFDPARLMGIAKRGELRIGNFADIVILNEALFSDRASLTNPYKPALGIEHVLVNGKTVIQNSTVTGKTSGVFLKKGSS
jgi:N-acyl-D-amino-acid deacylase